MEGVVGQCTAHRQTSSGEADGEYSSTIGRADRDSSSPLCPARQARPMQLRPYQREAIAAVLAARRQGHRRMMLSLPTGAGKTVIFAEMIRRARHPVLVLAHREELVVQARDKIDAALRRNPDDRRIVAIEQGEHSASGAGDDGGARGFGGRGVSRQGLHDRTARPTRSHRRDAVETDASVIVSARSPCSIWAPMRLLGLLASCPGPRPGARTPPGQRPRALRSPTPGGRPCGSVARRS